MKTCFNEATTKKSATLAENIVLCEKAGFDYIEIWICQLNEYLKTHTLKELADFLKNNHIKPFALDSFEDILFCTEDEYEKLKVDFERACLLAYAIGCDKIVMVPTVREDINTFFTKEEATGESIRVLRELAEIARPYGVKLAFEPIGFACCAVRSIAHATEIIEKVDLPNVGLTLDAFNNYLYDALNDMEDILKIPKDKIFIFHIDDAMKKPLSEYKLDHSDRLVPGEGELPCAEMTKMVKEAGYDDAVSVELFNEELYALPPETAIMRVFDAVDRLIRI